MTGSVRAAAGTSPALARAAPFALYIAFLMAGPLVAPWLPDARWLYAVRIVAVAAVLLAFARHYAELAAAPAAPPGQWALALATGGAVFLLWIHADLPWLSLGQSPAFAPTGADGALVWPLLAVRLFGAAVIVPIMEELFWRSFVLRWIDSSDFLRWSPARISLRALVVSAVLFGVEHALWFAGIVAGLAYGWLYRKSGNLWLPIVAHAATNLLLGVWVVATGNWQFW